MAQKENNIIPMIFDEAFYRKMATQKWRQQDYKKAAESVSYTHLTLPTIAAECRSRWSPDH